MASSSGMTRGPAARSCSTAAAAADVFVERAAATRWRDRACGNSAAEMPDDSPASNVKTSRIRADMTDLLNDGWHFDSTRHAGLRHDRILVGAWAPKCKG